MVIAVISLCLPDVNLQKGEKTTADITTPASGETTPASGETTPASGEITTTIATTTTEGPNAFLCKNRPRGYYFPDLADCTKSFLCHDSGAVLSASCNYTSYRRYNKYFDEETQSCLIDDDHCFKCPQVMISDERVDGVCQQFIRCIDGIPEYKECGKGLLYDGESHSCNHEKDVQCDACPKNDQHIPTYIADTTSCNA